MAKKIKKVQLPDGEILDLGGTGGGASMFDTKISDHELTFEESEGWALQGTYVYKEAVAGSRYGYPTFIEKCIEEKEQGTPTEVTLGENTITMYINSNGHQFYDIADKEAVDAWYNIYGTAWYYGVDTNAERVFLPRNKWFIQPTDDVSKLNTVNEAGLPNIESNFNATIGTSTNSTGAVKVDSTSNSAWWQGATNVARSGAYSLDASRSSSVYGNSDTVQPQSLNQLLYICVGNTSVNEALTNVIDITTSENDTLPLGYSTYQADNLSSAGWLKSTGSFESGTTYVTFYNEYRTRIGKKFSGGYVRSVDEDYTDYDLVIDEANQMFRLPLLDGSESLPSDKWETLTAGDTTSQYTAPANGWYTLATTSNSATGWVSLKNLTSGTNVQSSHNTTSYASVCIEARRGDVVKISYYKATPSFKFNYAQGNGSLYYKVGNAVQHLEVVDMLHEAELNNPFFYGMYQYYQTEPNNASWLASLGQWNSKGIYGDYYNWILENVGKDYFKLSTEEYTDYDWVVNTTDETFRLPVKVKGASGSAVVGNGKTVGLTDGTNQYGLCGRNVSSSSTLSGSDNAYGKSVGSSTGGNYIVNSISYGITTDPTKSGIETSDDGLTLYFYVGEVLQSANLINAGRALEQLAKVKAYKVGFPDYSAGASITLTVGSTITIPYDCMLWLESYGTSTGAIHLKLNDANGVSILYFASATTSVVGADRVYLRQGTNVYVVETANLRGSTIFPLKGE